LIPKNFIEDLLNRIDIVDIVGQSVTLKKSGSNYQGLCPFHQEKSPSFSVSQTKQFYHCFGCGVHGSAISFLMEYAGLSFIDAIEELARSIGVEVPLEKDNNLRVNQQSSVALNEVLLKASEYYRAELKKSDRAKNYLKGRGLSGEIAKHFGLGFAPDAWQNLDQTFGSYEDEAVATSLVNVGLMIQGEETTKGIKRYDRFRDRIMFPIRNTKGQVIGFGGRILDKGEPKYLNSPETVLFSKGQTLYGLFEARKSIREMSYVLVCEGYMDVVALAQLGFSNAVATLGTACTDKHISLLMRNAEKIIFSFDGDAAGKRAAKRAFEASIPMLADDKEIRFLFLPQDHDPDSFIRENGPEAFNNQVNISMSLSAFFLQLIIEGHDWETPEGRAQAQNNAKQYVQKMPAIAFRGQILREIANKTGTSLPELEKYYGLPVTQRSQVIKREGNSPLNKTLIASTYGVFKKEAPLTREQWRRKQEKRSLEEIAKQLPVLHLEIIDQLMKIFVQFPLLAKELKPEQKELFLDAAEQRSIEVRKIMGDLLSYCEKETEHSNFALFQSTLENSEYVVYYKNLLKNIFATEMVQTEAQTHLLESIKKLDQETIKIKLENIAQKIQKNEANQEEIEEYRRLTKMRR